MWHQHQWQDRDSFRRPDRRWLLRTLAALAAAGGAGVISGMLSAPARAAGEFIRLPEALPVPLLKLPDINGNMVDLRDFLGRVVVVNFWIWWCPSCKRELQELQWLWQAHPHDQLMVLGVHVGGRTEKARAFIRKADISFPILIDRRNEVAHRWGVTRYPMTVILGRDGLARYVIYGSREWNDEEATRIIGSLLTG
jgi:peroxiredoxin